MAIVKSIAIHGNTRGVKRYVENDKKTNTTHFTDKINEDVRTESNYMENVFNYVSNTLKTSINEKEILVSGYRCNPSTSDIEFQIIRDRYYSIKKENISENKQARTCYHFIQSFAPWDNVNPHLCHQIGMELAEKLYHYQAVVATHMDKEHLHNHIVMNAFSSDDISKYKDNMAAINQLRKYSDEISKKYGLEIILNPDRANDSSYKEWIEKKNNTSWKQKIRNDIDSIKETTNNWNEFKNKMVDAGYKLRETTSTITYILSDDNNLKARDKNLGIQYTKDYLINYWTMKEKNIADITIEKLFDRNNKKTVPYFNKIYVSRYSANGRKRSDLEILLLLAIKTLKKLGETFVDKKQIMVYSDDPVYKPLNWKLSCMMDSLTFVTSLGINNINDLNSRLTDSGSKLSHVRKELKLHKELIKINSNYQQYINTILDLQKYIDELKVNISDLCLPTYTREEIIKNKALSQPATADQKKDLYLLLESNSFYHLDIKFDHLSYSDADLAIKYLKDSQKNKCPDILIDYEKYEQKKLESKYNSIREKRLKDLKDKYSPYPLTDKQKFRIQQLINEKNLDIDINTLNQYDGLIILNYFVGQNPFSNKHIERNEAIQGDTIPLSMQTQCKELLYLKNETIPFDVSFLTNREASDLYNYLLNKDLCPTQLSIEDKSNSQEEEYNKFLLYYNIDDQQYINTYRNALIEITKLGIPVNDIKQIGSEFIEENNHLDSLLSQEINEANSYKNLKQLEKYINLANNVSFTHGFRYKDIPLTEIREDRLERLQEDENEKEDIETEKIVGNRLKKSDITYFKNI